jgi:RHS repeat-associated protein
LNAKLLTISDKSGNLLDRVQYTYTAQGNLATMISQIGATQYVYDALDQLIHETRPDGTVYEYSYDATGNRLSQRKTQGEATTVTTYAYDAADQLTAVDGVSYQHDENGNCIDDGLRSYTYDAENRLLSVQDKENGKTVASFTYRADGMRKTMTTASGTITFHYGENNNVAYETDGNNQVIASYTFEDDHPVSMTRAGKTYYYQLNGHGDVTALTDSTGARVATYEYDPYGALLRKTGSVENPYLYAGYRYDMATGFYYLQSRYYDPQVGRFLTKDTFEGDETIPLSQNQYTYAHNNPIMNTDSTGHGLPLIILTAVIASFVITLLDFMDTYDGYGWRYWKWSGSVKRKFFYKWAKNFVLWFIPLGSLKFAERGVKFIHFLKPIIKKGLEKGTSKVALKSQIICNWMKKKWIK